MITINDDDLPIVAALKIINGTINITDPIPKALDSAFGGNGTRLQFDIDEIKEIIDHLTIYYEARKKNSDVE